MVRKRNEENISLFYIRTLRSENKFRFQSWRPRFQRAVQTFRHVYAYIIKEREKEKYLYTNSFICLNHESKFPYALRVRPKYVRQFIPISKNNIRVLLIDLSTVCDHACNIIISCDLFQLNCDL